MLPRTLIPLSLGLALTWAGAAQAEDVAAWPAVSIPVGRNEGKAGDVALIVAVEDYAFAQDLPGAVLNGRDWATWLQTHRGVQTVKVLEDHQATREEILAAAEGAAARVQPGGRIWVIFIGHGAPSATGEGGMLVGVDAQQTARSLEARSVHLSELEAAMKGQQAEVVMVQDACFSGKAAGTDLAPGLAPMKVATVRVGPKWTVLAAGQNDQYAGPLSDGSRPAFSYLTLGALRGWGDKNKDGTVTASEAVTYANDAIFATVSGRKQEPQRFGPDLPLARSGGEKAPELSRLARLAAVPAEPLAPKPVSPSLAGRSGAVEAPGANPVASGATSTALQTAAAAIRAQAATDFANIEPLVRAPTAEGRKALEAYLDQYKGVEAQVGDQKERVELAEVSQVQAALGQLGQARMGAARSATGSGSRRTAVLGYTGAGLLSVGGLTMIGLAVSERNSLEGGVSFDDTTVTEAMAERNGINLLLGTGYLSLGAGIAVGLGTGFIWTEATGTGGGQLGYGGRW